MRKGFGLVDNGKSWTITRYECPRCLRIYVKRKKD